MNEIHDTSNRICRIVLDVIKSHGVVDIVCSPGSRNAPLLLGVAAREDFHPHVIIDERTAGFVALGIAQVSQRPVALICTSGTALLNYAPAVAEAFYQGLPLIVVSADRPEQWIDQDDSQTIHQNGALSNFVKCSYDLPSVSSPDKEMCWFADRVANDAMIEALSGRRGPVHLNLRLAPPLGKLQNHGEEMVRKISVLSGDGLPDKEMMDGLAEKLLSKKVMIVAGFMPPSAKLNKAIRTFNLMPMTVVMAETISNLHLPPENYCIDSLLSSCEGMDSATLQPDIVISLGGAIVSRKIKEYLRRCACIEHWSVGYQHTTVDCFQSLTMRIEADPAVFMTHLAGRIKRLMSKGKGFITPLQSEYKAKWAENAMRALRLTLDKAKGADWSDMRAYYMILHSVGNSTNLFLSNGTSVRYAQILSSVLPHASFCNRGVSGIDGSTSSAIGGALAYKNGLTCLLTGDMSFAYDIGALQMRIIPDSMRIIVVSNGGGGIFRFIGSTSGIKPTEVREKFFCADPELNIGAVAAAFGWDYLHADSPQSLAEALKVLADDSRRKTILEVTTPPGMSAEILSEVIK